MNTIIKIDTHAESKYMKACEDKISACKQLLSHVENIGLERCVKLFTEPMEVIYSHVGIEYKKDFPLYLSIEKIIELMEIPIDKIMSLAEQIKSLDADIDYSTLQPISRDFNVYTNSKEAEERYKAAYKLKQAIETAQQKLGIEFYLGDMIRSTKGMFATEDMRTLSINALWVNDSLR